MAITKEEVQKVAKLARIELTSEELEKFAPQLEKIIEYIDILNEVDTKDVPVTAHVTGLRDMLRPDSVEPLVPREALLEQSPLPIQDHQVKVPSIFDES